MKLIIRDGKIIARATDEYGGPELFIEEPEGFDFENAGRYQYLNDELVEVQDPRSGWAPKITTLSLTAEEVSGFEAITDLGELKAALKEKITNLRWYLETGGVVLSNGMEVQSGTDDQNRVTSVITNAKLAGVTVVDFKATAGWVTVTLSEVEVVAAVVALHVQKCFSKERFHHEAVDAIESIEDLRLYDITASWW